MKKKNLVLMLTLVTSLSVFLFACNKPAEETTNNKVNTEVTENSNNHDHNHEGNHEHEHEHDHEAREDAKLADWNGSWDNVYNHLMSDEAAPAIEAHAKEENESVDEVKAELEESRKADFGSFVVEDDKITFYSDVNGTGDVIDSDEYKMVGVQEVKHGSSTLHWYEFEGTKTDGKFAKLLLMDVHGEDSLAHFHMRYGNDMEKLLDEDSHWYPTLVKSGTPVDMITEMLHHH